MIEMDPFTDVASALLRLGLATVIGGVIGLNRELHHKPAGLRTHALVGLGAALVIYMSIELTVTDRIADYASLTRVIQGVLTGIGFLGAGVIFREEPSKRGEGKSIKGLTTAASIWVTACLGMACGAGRWPVVGVATLIILGVLIFGGPIEKSLHRKLFGQEEKAPVEVSDLD